MSEDKVERFLWAYSADQLVTAYDILKHLADLDMGTEVLPKIQSVSEEKFKAQLPWPGPKKTFKRDKKCRGGRAAKSVAKAKAKAQELTAEDHEAQEARRKSFMPTIGFCPRCGSAVIGAPVTCEDNKKMSGRHFYKECTVCPYYSEIFKKRNKFIEKEGG